MGTTLNGIRYPELVGVSADVPRDMKALAEDVDDRIYIIGEIRWLAGPPPSVRWLVADAVTPYSRTTYVKLWNYLRQGHAGTPGDPAPWGNGDGSTTFTVPDLAGRSPVGPGQAVGGNIETSPPTRVVGTKWGVNAVVLARTNTPAHDHGGGNHSHAEYLYDSEGNPEAGGQIYYVEASNGWAGVGIHTYAYSGAILNAVGGGTLNGDNPTPHRNEQPSVAIPAYIYAGA